MLVKKFITREASALAKYLLCMLLVVSMGFSFTNCSNNSSVPERDYAANQEKDLYDHSDTYDKLVEGCGVETADQLVDGMGEENLDRLAYGTGVTNLILLVNAVSDPDKLIAMVGNDYLATPSGLGVVRVVNFLNRVDAMMDEVTFRGTVPTVDVDDDTLGKIAAFINNTPLADIDGKVVDLLDAMGINRDMSDVSNAVGDGDGETTDIDRLDRIAKLIAHVPDTTKITDLMAGLTAAQVVDILGPLLSQLNDTKIVVEMLEFTVSLDDLTTLLIQGGGPPDGAVANLINFMNELSDGGGGKVAYLINNMTTIGTLIYQLNNITDPAEMGRLIESMEDNSTWANQAGGQQEWDIDLGAPSGADSGMVRLVGIMNGLDAASDALNPVKLSTILNGVSELPKMMRIIQDLVESDDLITLIDSFGDPASDNGPANLGYVTDNADMTIIYKVRQFLDGQRINGNVGTQSVFLGKVGTLMSALLNTESGPYKVSEMIDGISDIDKMIDLVYDVTNISNLSGLINGINPNSPVEDYDGNADGDIEAVTTMVYMVENVNPVTKLISIINEVAAGNVVSLLNQLADGSQYDDVPALNDEAAGMKLEAVINGVDVIDQLVFLLKNVTDFNKMSDLMNTLSIASNGKVADLIDGITGTNTFDKAGWTFPTDTGAADGIGKVVNMVDNISDLTQLAVLIEDVVVIGKLVTFVNEVTNSNYVVTFMNEVILDVPAGTPDPDINDMVDLLNTLNAGLDIQKIAYFIAGLDGTEDVFVAQLLAPYTEPYDPAVHGMGEANLALMLQSLDTLDVATGMAVYMKGISDTIPYQAGTVTNAEATIRLVAGGAVYLTEDFPPLGPVHVADMMNEVTIAPGPVFTGHANLAIVVNGLDAGGAIAMIGCGDGLGGSTGDFYTPCNNLLMWNPSIP